jgi:hypothetical protein
MIRSDPPVPRRARFIVVLLNRYRWHEVGWVTAVRVGIIAVVIRAVSVIIPVSIVGGVVAVVWITEAETKVPARPIIAAASIIPVMPDIISAIVPAVISPGTSIVVAAGVSATTGAPTTMLGVSWNRQDRRK